VIEVRGDSALQEALAAACRPLAFAARDDFAGLERVKDLEPGVARSLRALLERGLPPDLRQELEHWSARFEEDLEGEDRRRRIAAALAWLEPRLAPEWPDELLARPLTVLPGIGAKRAETLAKRGLASVADLLFTLPSGYDDRRDLVRVGDLEVGRHATFVAEVTTVSSGAPRGRGRRVLEAIVSDDTGSIALKWFRAADTIRERLGKGQRLLITGDVKRYRFRKEIVHPEVEPLDPAGEDAGPVAPTDADALAGLRAVVPRYPAKDGVPPRTLRRLIASALVAYGDCVVGWLPASAVRERGLPRVADALRTVHAPPPDAEVESYEAFRSAAHERLVLEELYLLEVGLALRAGARERAPGIAIDTATERARRAPGSLPFALTKAQARAWQEIAAELARPHPMHRLLQGDVGSGKTAVAFLAAVAVAAAGHQTALMAPTELLAEQHARTLRRLAAGSSEARQLRIALLTASVPRAEAQSIRRALALGHVDLVVGTHALVQREVDFARLALAIVDEQHRFGVRARQALAEKGVGAAAPHVLVMTATPIPRTLAMTLYGDLEVSELDELPPGRQPVRTELLREGEGQRVSDEVRATLARGEQVYVVYPLVEESEKVDLRSAIESTERIRRAFADVRVDLVHGRLDPGERAAAMDRFERGESRILVSTTVIEVGVDVPDATLMVIEHAERFGLAQLHQLRGRVGRGERPGRCLLVARRFTETGEERLRSMLETTDGFEIANADLRIRGPGEFLGTRQSGTLPDLRIADLLRDARWLALARSAARQTVRADPGLAGLPGLRRAVELRWGDRLDLAGVG